MRRTARLIALAAFMTLGATALVGPRQAFAQSADTMQAERARLRVQLDKVNAEIDALKRAGGSVRDDYRLRARLADAESLARRRSSCRPLTSIARRARTSACARTRRD